MDARQHRCQDTPREVEVPPHEEEDSRHRRPETRTGRQRRCVLSCDPLLFRATPEQPGLITNAIPPVTTAHGDERDDRRTHASGPAFAFAPSVLMFAVCNQEAPVGWMRTPWRIPGPQNPGKAVPNDPPPKHAKKDDVNVTTAKLRRCHWDPTSSPRQQSATGARGEHRGILQDSRG